MRVHETVLYASDVTAVATFYRDALGLRAISAPDEHSAAFRLDGDAVLLIFDPERSSAPGRYVPSHGANGRGHVAFSVVPGELEPMIARLADNAVAIEREITWPLGGHSVYVRDPAGNSVELIEGEAWEP
jgi:catechol 2,3-dioxygenase-like lactoylglutathione lyase family enzyme